MSMLRGANCSLTAGSMQRATRLSSFVFSSTLSSATSRSYSNASIICWRVNAKPDSPRNLLLVVANDSNSNSINSINRHSYISSRRFFKLNEGPIPSFFKRKEKKDNNTIVINKNGEGSKELNEPISLKSRIVGFVLSKVMGFVAKSIHSQLEEMEKTFDTIVSHAENALNSDPKLRDVLGSDIEIVDIRTVEKMKTENNSSKNHNNVLVDAESDRYELKLDNILIAGSKGLSCNGSLFACEEKDGDGELVIQKLQVVLPNGKIIDIKIPKFSGKVINIKV